MIYLATSLTLSPDGTAPVRKSSRAELLDEIGSDRLKFAEQVARIGGDVCGLRVTSGGKVFIIVEVHGCDRAT